VVSHCLGLTGMRAPCRRYSYCWDAFLSLSPYFARSVIATLTLCKHARESRCLSLPFHGSRAGGLIQLLRVASRCWSAVRVRARRPRQYLWAVPLKLIAGFASSAGTPARTRLSTNSTCQLEKTEKLSREGYLMPATSSPSGPQRFILRDGARTATPTKCWG
jgi:hypothetical protein